MASTSSCLLHIDICEEISVAVGVREPIFIHASKWQYLSAFNDIVIEHFDDSIPKITSEAARRGHMQLEFYLCAMDLPLSQEFPIGVICDLAGSLNRLELVVRFCTPKERFRSMNGASMVLNQLKAGLSCQDTSLGQFNKLTNDELASLTSLASPSNLDESVDPIPLLRRVLYSADVPSSCGVKLYITEAGIRHDPPVIVLKVPVVINGLVTTVAWLLDYLKLQGVRRSLCIGWAVPSDVPIFFLQQSLAYADGFLHLVCVLD